MPEQLRRGVSKMVRKLLYYKLLGVCTVRFVYNLTVRKFDDDKFRWLSSGEYIQMSGRAGRKGIDNRGVCILMVDEKLEPSTAKMMVKGNADCLNSAFHLSHVLLNQLRCEDGDPENLLRSSFYQFQAYRAIPDPKTREILKK